MSEQQDTSAPKGLLEGPPRVVNLGLSSFAEELEAAGVEVIQVDWSPPAGGDAKLAELLSRMGP
jgi:hypothetical protein